MADYLFSSYRESSRRAGAVLGPRWQARPVALACFVLEATLISAAGPLAAQGVTGAAVDGRVSGAAGLLEDAMVLVTNTSNGERWRTTTSAGGRYFLEYLTVGGPYRIEVRAVGFEPALRDSVFLRLGQRLTTDFTLAPAVAQLEEITVTGSADPMFSAARTGPAQVFPDSLIARIPLNVRAYTELALLSPQVTISSNGGLSFSGQHDRYNSIQVDGATNSWLTVSGRVSSRTDTHPPEFFRLVRQLPPFRS